MKENLSPAYARRSANVHPHYPVALVAFGGAEPGGLKWQAQNLVTGELGGSYSGPDAREYAEADAKHMSELYSLSRRVLKWYPDL